jgi:hypothetical protein
MNFYFEKRQKVNSLPLTATGMALHPHPQPFTQLGTKMNATEFATLSLKELKSICASHEIEPVGDKRSKQTWISAIETFQSEQTVIEIIEMPTIPDPFENQLELAVDLPLVEGAVTACTHRTMAESIVQGTGYAKETPAPQPTAPNQQRGASLVVLVIATLLCALLVVMVTGLRSLIPLIAAVGQVSGSIWRSIPRSSIGTNSIPLDYFPA